jgi:hypothetical protein
MTIDLEQQLAEVRREIRMRQRVYPRQVAAGRMSQETAGGKIEILRAVEHTLLELLRQRNPELGLEP